MAKPVKPQVGSLVTFKYDDSVKMTVTRLMERDGYLESVKVSFFNIHEEIQSADFAPEALKVIKK